MTAIARITGVWCCVVGILLLTAGSALAQQAGKDVPMSALSALIIWMPFILKGFGLNLLMSVLAMTGATIVGVFMGFMQISRTWIISFPARIITQLFRNAPWLVILFAIMLLFPFKLTLPDGQIVLVPGWVKATIGFSLPVMANISEILRGAVNSIPTGQWESADSLAFTRYQTLRHVILPQCIRRMLPPWMNWYALLTLMTPMAAILGVQEALGNTQAAMEAAGSRPEYLVPFYTFLLLIFFLFIFPISLWTRRLERQIAENN